MTDNTLRNSPAYRVAYSMYVALGGDPMTEFNSVEEIYDAIDVLFGKGNNRITVEAIAMEIVENGDYNFDDEEVTGYKPVNIKVEVPQKYTDEQVENIRVEAENNGYNNGYGVGMNDGYNNGYGVGYAEGDAAGQQTGYTTGYGEGFTAGETEGYNDGYAEGLDDGAEDQKALLEDITITENGVYEKEDGYKKVTVEMAAVPSGDGFDFSVLGYDANDTVIANNAIQDIIDTSVTVYNAYNPDSIWPANYSSYKINDRNILFSPKFDLSKQTYVGPMDSSTSNYYGLYESCSKMVYCPDLDLSSTLSTVKMFKYCSSLTAAPKLITPNVTNTNSMFYGCEKLTSVPLFDTSNVTNTGNMFYNCRVLTSVPLFDTSNVTNTGNMFYGCYKLNTIPEFNTSKASYMRSMFEYCNALNNVPLLDCSSATNVENLFGSSSLPFLTNIGGFKNLGMQPSLLGTTSIISPLSYLTHDSLMNVINNLYDRATAGLSILTLKLSYMSKTYLSDEEIAIATNKGWIIS